MDVAGLRHIFASRIRKLREGKMNQGEFADSVGISRGAMSYCEQELRTPDIGVLRAICEKYGISADYLLGLIPDTNHAVSDICRETKLTPGAAKKLRLISRLVNVNYRSYEQMMDAFDDDFIEVLKLAPFTSLPQLLSVLLESDEGLNVLGMLGAIILGAEIDNGGHENPRVKLKSASQNFEVSFPIENITAALWVNIQTDANKLKEKIQGAVTQSE